MAKKQFKTESKRILDLMINSIYTHREIFLRELISNASDALDKLAYRSLTDDKVSVNRADLHITLIPDPEARTLIVRDNGIGMTKEELDTHLGTIAKSGSLQFKKEITDAQGVDESDLDIIGQFGVGFYSSFMVSDKVIVRSRACGSDEAWQWESSGTDGYTITPCQKEIYGTEITMYIKPDTDEEDFSQYLSQDTLEDLVKKYSDYVHFPIEMEKERTREKPKPEDAGDDYKPEYETYREWATLNSMVPLWYRPKDEVTEEEYADFYKEKYGDFENPLAVIHVAAEGNVEYRALIFIPARQPYDFQSREFEKGLQLYSSGVMVMDRCAELVPNHFRFLRGVVDSPDLSLNISREMLQQTRQLQIIAKNIEKKVKAELVRIQKEEPESYKSFWHAFGLSLKLGVLADYGAHKDLLKDLLLFWSSHSDAQTTLADYVARMPEDQKYIYFASGESPARIAKLPQVERIADKGYEVLYLNDEPDEFLMQTLREYDGKTLKSVSDEDALPESEEEKQAAEEKTEENKDVLAFVKETLGDRIHEARISKVLKSGAVCLSLAGSLSIEMAKYFIKMNPESADQLRADQILELNPDSEAFAALRSAMDTDRERAKTYVELLYQQALLIAGLPLEDPVAYAALVCSLMK
ncbi:MAG: molecular chaperone HtpG [Oscillospiraceae bacterium]|nr:molecular chaperone HtpG [Oscillospiraceae bacterium]